MRIKNYITVSFLLICLLSFMSCQKHETEIRLDVANFSITNLNTGKKVYSKSVAESIPHGVGYLEIHEGDAIRIEYTPSSSSGYGTEGFTVVYTIIGADIKMMPSTKDYTCDYTIPHMEVISSSDYIFRCVSQIKKGDNVYSEEGYAGLTYINADSK